MAVWLDEASSRDKKVFGSSIKGSSEIDFLENLEYPVSVGDWSATIYNVSSGKAS